MKKLLSTVIICFICMSLSGCKTDKAIAGMIKDWEEKIALASDANDYVEYQKDILGDEYAKNAEQNAKIVAYAEEGSFWDKAKTKLATTLENIKHPINKEKAAAARSAIITKDAEKAYSKSKKVKKRADAYADAVNSAKEKDDKKKEFEESGGWTKYLPIIVIGAVLLFLIIIFIIIGRRRSAPPVRARVRHVEHTGDVGVNYEKVLAHHCKRLGLDPAEQIEMYGDVRSAAEALQVR